MSVPQEKQMIRLIDEIRALLPDLLLTLGAIERLNPPSDLLARIEGHRTKLKAICDKARQLEEATDCMPAAEKGRQQRA